MVDWEILPPIEHDRVSEEMEVPQVHHINGRWYLIFCTLGRFLCGDCAKRFGEVLPEKTNFSMVGESPFGPFHIHGTGQLVQHRTDAYFYAVQLRVLRANLRSPSRSRRRDRRSRMIMWPDAPRRSQKH